MDFSEYSNRELVQVLNSWAILHKPTSHYRWDHNYSSDAPANPVTDKVIKMFRQEALKRDGIRAVPVQELLEETEFHCIEGNYTVAQHFEKARHSAVGKWGGGAFIDWEYNDQVQYLYFD